MPKNGRIRRVREHQKTETEAGKFKSASEPHTHTERHIQKNPAQAKRDNKTHLFIYLLLLFIRIKSTDNRWII